MRLEPDVFRSTLSEMVGHVMVPLDTHGIYIEGNMENNSSTFTIDISLTPRKIKNIYIGADCSPEEIHIYIDLFKEFRDIFPWSYKEIPRIYWHMGRPRVQCSRAHQQIPNYRPFQKHL
jgi:hypothetical protein